MQLNHVLLTYKVNARTNALVNVRPVIRYKKWWWRFIPNKRRELKVMQALLEYYYSQGNFQHKCSEYIKDALLYGIEPIYEGLE